MALDKDLDDRIRQGIKDRDLKTVDVLRMLKTRLLERRTAKASPARSTTRSSSR